jgi:diguanylate cyclase (GGDEF)-like protein
MMIPVYRFGSAHDTVALRRAHVTGYTVAVFRAGDLVEKILTASGRVNIKSLNLSVYFGPRATAQHLAYGTGELPVARDGWLGLRDGLFLDEPKVLRQSFDAAGHSTHMQFWAPPPPFLDAHPGSLIVLIVGILSSLFAALYLKAVKSRSERIGRLVDERTRDLTQSELLQRGQNRILHIIAAGEEVQNVLDETILFLEEHIDGHCLILLANDCGTQFNRRAGPSVAPALLQRLVQLPIRAGMGVAAETVLGHAPLMIADIATDAMMGDVRDAFLAQGYAACGCWPILSKRGRVLGALAVLYDRIGVPDVADSRMATIGTDLAGIVVETRWAEDRIRHMAHYDELTGLPNRFLYAQYLNKAIAQAKRLDSRVGVLFLDLDRFKHINETFSQEVGDMVLRDMSVKLAACLRDPDSIARSGGDEFIVLIENYNDTRYLGEVAQRLLLEASRPFIIDGQECRLSASIGIATYPDDAPDAQLLLKNADIAMYRAKAMNRNNYQFYSAEMNTHTVERLAFEAMMRRAIDRREFIAHYQPKVDVRTGRIVGAEALVRWQHPQQGLLAPGVFIGVAEEAGLIGRIGMMVLENTCRDINAFDRLGIEFGRIAINLSGIQFNDANLLEDINSVVAAHDVRPHALEFEITESMVMHNREQAIELMDGIKARGFTLSIDDFGTGYSSLAYLKRFPVDSVKIDKSFINDITTDANDSAIVQAIIVMSHALGMKVVAEGVETADQLAMLESFRCNAYQGWYFSKAVPAHEFIELVRRQVSADILALESLSTEAA